MLSKLKPILLLQELDMKMIRLMEVKKKRQEELLQIHTLREDLREQAMRKQHEVLEIKKNIKLDEVRVRELEERLKHLDQKQGLIKKVEEYNALQQEMTMCERNRSNIQLAIEEKAEQLAEQEKLLAEIEESLEQTNESSRAIEKEIQEGIALINKEGRALQEERKRAVEGVDQELLAIYERLLNNKKDQVVVPVEHRGCSGCHMVVTAQHENVVRKGERLIFCEHCSRIHYWPEQAPLEGEAETEGVTRRRRRRASASNT